MNKPQTAKHENDLKEGSAPDEPLQEVTMDASDMWREKRERQRQDMAALESGELSSEDVNWFAGGIARKAKIIGPLF